MVEPSKRRLMFRRVLKWSIRIAAGVVVILILCWVFQNWLFRLATRRHASWSYVESRYGGIHPQKPQQTEIPRKPIWRKFNVCVGRCKRCHRRVQGRHPLQTSDALGAAASQLGPDAQAVAVHLNKDLGLSHGKVARFFGAIFGVPLSRWDRTWCLVCMKHRERVQ